MSEPKIHETRLFDLVRYKRAELLSDGLITREEYAWLVSAPTEGKPNQGSISARRLETYDEMRKRLDELEAKQASLVREVRRQTCEDVLAAMEKVGPRALNANMFEAVELLRDAPPTDQTREG